MATRERMCAQCGRQFSYAIARGADRAVCSAECRAARRIAQLAALPVVPCSVDGCSRKRRHPSSLFCEAHYYRLRRTGSLGDPKRKGQYKQKRGYVVQFGMSGHALTTPSMSNVVYQHRVVFFAAHGEGPFNCHVCGKAVTWVDMHVDHLNDKRGDNRIENLAPACEVCNPWRAQSRAQATRRERHGRFIEFNGERLTLTDWARRCGVRPGSISQRLERGWPLERALTEGRGNTGPRQKAKPIG